MNTYTFGIHIRTVLSRDAEATKWPEGENVTPMTASLWPTKRYALIWGLKFHIIRHESSAPEALMHKEQKDLICFILVETKSNILSDNHSPSCFILGLKSTLVIVSRCPLKWRSSDGSSWKLTAWQQWNVIQKIYLGRHLSAKPPQWQPLSSSLLSLKLFLLTYAFLTKADAMFSSNNQSWRRSISCLM